MYGREAKRGLGRAWVLLIVFLLSGRVWGQPSNGTSLRAETNIGIRVPSFFEFSVDPEMVQPPLNFWRLSGEFLAGYVIGTAGLMGGGFLGAEVFSFALRRVGPEEAAVGAILGYFLVGGGSLAFGVPLAVWLIGNIGNETGDYWAAWMGGPVCGLVSLVGILLLQNYPEAMKVVNPYVVEGVIGGYSLGAVIGFQLSRRYKDESALISIKDGSITPGFPLVLVRVDEQKRVHYGLTLIEGRW